MYLKRLAQYLTPVDNIYSNDAQQTQGGTGKACPGNNSAFGDESPSSGFLYRHQLPLYLYTPYATCPIGLSSSIPGAMKFVLGSPVALAAEQRAIVGELEM
jgi:hypothetical protein